MKDEKTCPVCGKEDVQTGRWEQKPAQTPADVIKLPVHCPDCGQSYWWYYRIEGFSQRM